MVGTPTKRRSKKRRELKTSTDKTLKEKTQNGTKRRMENAGRLRQNVDSEKRRHGQNVD
jgi:hypothetical protein